MRGPRYVAQFEVLNVESELEKSGRIVLVDRGFLRSLGMRLVEGRWLRSNRDTLS
jgi:hypothetical protein